MSEQRVARDEGCGSYCVTEDFDNLLFSVSMSVILEVADTSIPKKEVCEFMEQREDAPSK